MKTVVGGVLTSWLVCLTLERVVRVCSPDWGHCVVYLGKTLYSHGASNPGV